MKTGDEDDPRERFRKGGCRKRKGGRDKNEGKEGRKEGKKEKRKNLRIKRIWEKGRGVENLRKEERKLEGE